MCQVTMILCLGQPVNRPGEQLVMIHDDQECQEGRSSNDNERGTIDVMKNVTVRGGG